MDQFPIHLRYWAETRFESLSACARAIGLTPQDLTKIMNGKRDPGSKILERILQAGGSLNWLVGGVEPVDVVPLATLPSGSRVPLNARTLEHDRAELDKIEIVPEASEGRERAKSERKRTGLDPFKKIDDSADKKGRAKRTEKRGTQTGS